jgi:hypothetical protein
VACTKQKEYRPVALTKVPRERSHLFREGRVLLWLWGKRTRRLRRLAAVLVAVLLLTAKLIDVVELLLKLIQRV